MAADLRIPSRTATPARRVHREGQLSPQRLHVLNQAGVENKPSTATPTLQLIPVEVLAQFLSHISKLR